MAWGTYRGASRGYRHLHCAFQRLVAHATATGCAIGLLWGASAQADDASAEACRKRDRILASAEPRIAALYPSGAPAKGGKTSRFVGQNGTFDLPGYLSRRGEVSLVGPEGLIEDSQRLRLELRPDADHALSLKLTW
ncbi:MAG: hypothetical protein U1E87_09870 [Alphaproteobacteria bacterium]